MSSPSSDPARTIRPELQHLTLEELQQMVEWKKAEEEERRRDELRHRIEALQEEKTRLRKEVDEVKDRVGQVEGRIAEIEREIASLRTKMGMPRPAAEEKKSSSARRVGVTRAVVQVLEEAKTPLTLKQILAGLQQPQVPVEVDARFQKNFASYLFTMATRGHIVRTEEGRWAVRKE